jgi:UDP-GlcNAc:undecaprenyl-phosphate/decaprenyl-phosphate GlcNAc-1-phosphate transferase
MIALWVFLGSVVAGILMLGLLWRTLSGEKLSRTNYRGIKVATAAGIVFIPAFLLIYLPTFDYASRRLAYDSTHATNVFHATRAGMTSMLVLVLGFCFLGFLDDVAGDSSAKGFRGHFSEALHGRFTTGLVKAFLGFIVAMVALQPEMFTVARTGLKSYGIWIMSAAVVALAANFFNLLDLRPGRAMKVFFPALALCAGLTLRYGAVGVVMNVYPPLYYYMTPALAIAGIALVLFPGDLREKFMLGDAGSNVLGAVVGLGLVYGTSFWWRLGVLILLLILNILSEKYSFSDAIASNRVLNWLDSTGRKGRGTAGANNN